MNNVKVSLTLFVSDIPSTVNNFRSLFADDTKIHAALFEEHSSYTTSLQEDLDSRHANAVSSCKMQNHAFRETHPEYKIYPTDDGTLYEIAQTAEEKDFGVTIDGKLIFSRHIQIQVNKAN